MPRIRSLKHDFFLDEILAECDMAARILFAGLWVVADKAGRLPDQPNKIKAQILPYDDVDADVLLKQLADRNLVIRYKAEAKPYIQIRSFTKHQKPHPKEPESEIPPPPGKAADKPIVSLEQGGTRGTDLPCVYFIQPKVGGLIKIGYACNVKLRIGELQIGCPVKLSLLGIIPAAISREKEIHRQFAHLRQDGEWFEAAPELLTFIKETATAVKFHDRAVKKQGTVEKQAGMGNGSRNGSGDLGSSVSGNGLGDLGEGDSVGTGASAPHPKSTEEVTVWKLGVGKLMDTGSSETDARAFFGQQVKNYGKSAVARAVTEMYAQEPAEPRAYIVAVLQGQNGSRRPNTNVERNIDATKRFIERKEAEIASRNGN